ncbi:hypothetical protein [Staphylococcus capitis]|uniref:hypothetical protein n=1 Tax=Staphylococcus capitis TaxID=29388 RepID=UPI0005DFCA14|nr:hypothetical protein [Staphylococcus capitis]BAW91094.1 hypothetical protein JMUB0001_1596 [Staphylococcus capitis]CQD31602.1 conserved hypothetical protein [Staphylococcus capitis]
MSVEIKGVSEVLKQIERRYGREAMREKSDKALNEASDYFLNTLKKEFESFKDTRASIDEMTKTKPYSKGSIYDRAILIEWVGPMNRKNIIHLNEHGYTRNGKKYTPRGFAVIAKALQASQYRYREIIKRELTR